MEEGSIFISLYVHCCGLMLMAGPSCLLGEWAWRCDKGERFYVAYGGLKTAIIPPPHSECLDDRSTGDLVVIY